MFVIKSLVYFWEERSYVYLLIKKIFSEMKLYSWKPNTLNMLF